MVYIISSYVLQAYKYSICFTIFYVTYHNAFNILTFRNKEVSDIWLVNLYVHTQCTFHKTWSVFISLYTQSALCCAPFSYESSWNVMPFCLKSAFACWISYKKRIIINDDDDNNRSNMMSYCSILDIINTLNVKEFSYWLKKLFLQLSNNLTILTRLSLFCVLPHTFMFSPYNLFMLLTSLEIKC